MTSIENGESGASVRAKLNSALARYDQDGFANVAALLADVTLAYGQVSAGDIIRTRSEGFAYTVAASGASDHHVATAGGVKLYVLSSDVRAFGAVGDGVADDTAAFAACGTAFSGQIVQLDGLSYAVSAAPTGAIYTDGTFIISGTSYRTASSRGAITSTTDTGGLDTAYSGGTLNLAPFSGRTTPDLYGLFASQNSRSRGPSRAVNIGSIYCDSQGNVSGNYSSRQSLAWVPQSVNIGSEECWVWGGFRGGNYSSIFSGCENESNANLASRSAIASGRNSANIATEGSFAGRGGGARFTVTLAAGAVSSVAVDRAGVGYHVGDALAFMPRASAGAGAAATVAAINGSGGVTSVTVSLGGSGYSGTVDATVDNGTGDFSANVAATGGSVTSGEASANIASNAQTTSGLRSASIACQSGMTSGQNAAQVGSNTGAASGNQSVIIGSNGSVASGTGSVVIGGNNATSDFDGAVVVGRRVKPGAVRAFAYGDASAGVAATANRKFEVLTNGNVTAAGTFTGSTVYADYAEYFENLEAGVIPLGTIVALDGRKVRAAHNGDAIVGVISGTALIVAGDSPFSWSRRYLTGEFGEPLYHNVPCVAWSGEGDFFDGTVGEAERLGLEPPNDARFYASRELLENPEYDPTRENVARSARPDQWSCVGILGQVHVRVDASVSPGDYVAASLGGVGKKADAPTNMRCMELRYEFDAAKGYAVGLCLLK